MAGINEKNYKYLASAIKSAIEQAKWFSSKRDLYLENIFLLIFFLIFDFHIYVVNSIKISK